MENSFQTSFIPKKPISTTSSSGKSTRPPTSIFTALSFFVLIIVGALCVGLFLYKNYLIKEKQTLSTSLERVRDTFEKDTIDELELYDKRSSAAKRVLSQHIVLTPLFTLLGAITIPQVQYTNFRHETGSQGFQVLLTGVANDYKSVALQADAFNSAKGRSFKNVVFSDINKDKNNNVNFHVEFTVDPNLLAYDKNILLEQSQPKLQPTALPVVNPTEAETAVPVDNKPQ
ncbi:MAG: hypothetical protein AAB477_02110 [Patescibacteria group bacterium]